MANPKFKTSKSKRDMRRSHHALKPSYGSTCANCGTIKVPHSVCNSCGFYKGKQVMAVKAASSNSDESFSVD